MFPLLATLVLPAAACTAAGINQPAGAGTGGGPATGLAGSSGAAGRGGAGGLPVFPGNGGVTGRSGAGGIGSGCGLQMFDLERKPAEVLLLLDRSASMQDPPDGATAATPKWDLVLPAVKQIVMDTNGAVSWGLKVFPEGEGNECAAGNVTSRVDVPIAPMNAGNVVSTIDATSAEGNGTPTGDAIAAAVAYLQTLTSKNPKYILLATDGEPSCAGTTKSSDSARTLAVTAATSAAAAGFHTFVVGVATTKSSATGVLNMLADAGREPRNDPRPLATRYYLGTTQAELSAALAVITGQVSSCIFPLDPPPPVPDNPNKLGVYLTGNATKIPYDATMTNGWSYLGTGATAVQVFGGWCDMIKTAGANKVQIIYGCPDIDVP